MTEFDVNELLFSFENEMAGTEDDVYNWLEANVGPMKQRFHMTDSVPFEGEGWRIVTRKYTSDIFGTKKSANVITWHLEIEDDQKATLFALKWM